MALKYTIRLSTYSQITAESGSPVGGEGSQLQAKESEILSALIIGVPQQHQATQP